MAIGNCGLDLEGDPHTVIGDELEKYSDFYWVGDSVVMVDMPSWRELKDPLDPDKLYLVLGFYRGKPVVKLPKSTPCNWCGR